jgi:hypothetical protein
VAAWSTVERTQGGGGKHSGFTDDGCSPCISVVNRRACSDLVFTLAQFDSYASATYGLDGKMPKLDGAARPRGGLLHNAQRLPR